MHSTHLRQDVQGFAVTETYPLEDAGFESKNGHLL